jgi:hypothetical protein
MRLIASTLLAVCAARPVAALDASVELRRCATLTEDAQRLQCYDRLAAALQAPTAPAVAATAASRAAPATAPSPATASTPVAVPSPRTAPPAPPSPAAVQEPSSPATDIKQFGVSNGPLQTKIAAVRLKSITATVAGLSTRAGGEQVVTLDNDQVWQQNGPGDYFPVKPGDKIEISEGVLGSYTMWAPSIRRASKVTRIR